MELSDLPIAVQKLTGLGELWERDDWPDYAAYGITAEHIPALIQVLQSWREFAEDLAEDEGEEVAWTPMHAWRALAQLQAVEALPALLDMLHLIKDEESDLVQEEMPVVLGMLGPGAVPGLVAYIQREEKDSWARLAAAEGLTHTGTLFPETRDAAVKALRGALRGFRDQDMLFNGFLVSFLADLNAVEAAPLVEEAFQAGRIDESVIGDFEDYQVAVGLLEHRLTHPKFPGSRKGKPGEMLARNPEDIQRAIHENREKRIEKNKRKQAKAMHRHSGKKKKKK